MLKIFLMMRHFPPTEPAVVIVDANSTTMFCQGVKLDLSDSRAKNIFPSSGVVNLHGIVYQFNAIFSVLID